MTPAIVRTIIINLNLYVPSQWPPAGQFLTQSNKPRTMGVTSFHVAENFCPLCGGEKVVTGASPSAIRGSTIAFRRLSRMQPKWLIIATNALISVLFNPLPLKFILLSFFLSSLKFWFAKSKSIFKDIFYKLSFSKDCQFEKLLRVILVSCLRVWWPSDPRRSAIAGHVKSKVAPPIGQPRLIVMIKQFGVPNIHTSCALIMLPLMGSSLAGLGFGCDTSVLRFFDDWCCRNHWKYEEVLGLGLFDIFFLQCLFHGGTTYANEPR